MHKHVHRAQPGAQSPEDEAVDQAHDFEPRPFILDQDESKDIPTSWKWYHFRYPRGWGGGEIVPKLHRRRNDYHVKCT